ncbi:ABC transporter substrate-binding protein [Solibacillus sp. CAU 1738]|uniref:ABC transporter substrate-binding protein n=1 Tax=Solibacillus sp. CAU 1738 TaxID=3140363 RepID=UPI0032618E31
MITYLLSLYNHFEIGKQSETSIDELAEIWHCSTRYAKTIVKKCNENNWIDWATQQGRGKKPSIFLRLSKLEAIYVAFDDYWQSNRFNEAYEMLHHYKLLSHPQVEQWLNDRYGFSNNNTLDSFRYPYWNVALNVDPIYGLSRHDMHFYNQVHEPLFTYCEKTKEAKPNLVYGYHSHDAKQWSFTLRKDVFFHDGTKLTSTDVVASLKRAKHLINMVEISSISATSLYHLEIKLSEENTLFPRFLSTYKLSIVPAKWIEAGAQGMPIGCGPFYVKEMNESLMRLTTFPKYFKERPWIDEVEVIHTPEEFKFGVSPKPYAEYISQQKITYQEQGADFILLNATNGSLQDVNFRQALFEAIDPLSYCLFEQGETVAHSFMTSKKREHLVRNSLNDYHFPHLRIGIQQIRPGANHLREAKILSDFLTANNIPHSSELAPIRSDARYVADHYDLFVGGIAIGQDHILALLHAYESNQFALKAFMEDEQVKSLLKQAKLTWNDEEALGWLNEVEDLMVDAFVLKFLSHRQHHFYIRDDSPFAGIGFDDHGKIDYRKIYR